MFERKYQIEELSPTRVYVRNKSFWRNIGKENIAKVVEGLNNQGREVCSTIPFRNSVNGYDYLVILKGGH